MKIREMNLPNKLSLLRILMALIIIGVLLFPFHDVGLSFPKYLLGGVYVDLKYFIAGFLFIAASATDYFDGKIARDRKIVTDFGKTVDAIADKVLVNSVLIILSAQGFIPPMITVIVIVRDSITNAIKMVAGNKGDVIAASNLGKIKTACLMGGIVLTLFYNLPFEMWNLPVADFLLVFAAIMAIISGYDYYSANKKYLFPKK